MARILVTSFDSAYFKAGLTLIAAVHRTSLDVVDRIVIYDLGLTVDQRRFLTRCEKVEVRVFPDVVRTFFNGYLEPKQFAWKPCAIKHAGSAGDLVFWLDAGAMPVRSLRVVFELIEQDDILLVQDEIRITDRTFARALDLMQATGEERGGQMLCAGIQGHKVGGRYQTMIDEAYAYSQNPEIVRGPWERHRHDQSIYSLLAVRHRAPTQSLWRFGEFRGPDMSPDQVIYVHRRAHHDTRSLRICLPKDVSVCLTTCNAGSGVETVLESLAGQTGLDCDRWEVVAVDNNSTDGTVERIERWAGRMPFRVRVVTESRQGSFFARRRAALEAEGKVAVILDDDMTLDPGWLARCVEFMAGHLEAGIVGGRIEVESDAQLPVEWEGIKWMFGVRSYMGDPARLVDQGSDWVEQPCGGGTAVRTPVLQEVYLSESFLLPGRNQGGAGSNEDVELAWQVVRRGWQGWFDPLLLSTHLVPAERLRLESLARLQESVSRSCVAVESLMERGFYPPGRKWALRYFVWALMNLARRFSGFWSDHITARLDAAGAWGRTQGMWVQLLAAFGLCRVERF